MEKLYHAFCGMMMGAADMIPGVSGGTMALLLGIYARLVAAVDVVRAPFAAALLRGRFAGALKMLDWALIIPLAAGLLLGMMFVLKVIELPALLHSHREQVYGVFFGLILGSIALLLQHAARVKLRWVWFALGVAGGLAITQTGSPQLPTQPVFFFCSGALAISAMLLPGISGSYILLILGHYAVILQALDTLDWAIIAPFVSGCAVGLVCFSKALNWLMRHYSASVLWLMAGLLLGTLPKLWPFASGDWAPYWPSAPLQQLDVFALMGAGLFAAWLLSLMSAGRH